jgi:hypothetical protein
MSLVQSERVFVPRACACAFLDKKRGQTVITADTQGNVIGHRNGEVIVQFDGIAAMTVVPVTALKRVNAPVYPHGEKL